MRPRVSVCVPAYQSAGHLQDLLDSVWRQDFEEFELVVVDDGSTDETPAILAAQSDPRLRFFRRERNLGQVATVAETVARARGELVKFLDADDVLHPQCVGAMVAALDAHPHAVVAFSRRTILVEDPDDPVSRAWVKRQGELHHAFARIEEVNNGRKLLCEYLRAGLSGNWMAEPAGVMARRADVVAVGSYNLRVRQNNDMDLWARLMCRGDVAFIDRPLYQYRLAFSGVTGGSAAHERQWLDPLWTAEGLAQMPGFPEPTELAATRRRLLVKAMRRAALSPLREPREALGRLADLASYGAYRLAHASGRADPLHPPIALWRA